MDNTETLRKLIDADREASRLLDGAAALGEGSDARIELGKSAVTEKYAAKIHTAVHSAEVRETARAEAELARMDKLTQERLSALKADFSRSREDYVRKIFGLVTGESDGR